MVAAHPPATAKQFFSPAFTGKQQPQGVGGRVDDGVTGYRLFDDQSEDRIGERRVCCWAARRSSASCLG